MVVTVTSCGLQEHRLRLAQIPSPRCVPEPDGYVPRLRRPNYLREGTLAFLRRVAGAGPSEGRLRQPINLRNERVHRQPQPVYFRGLSQPVQSLKVQIRKAQDEVEARFRVSTPMLGRWRE